MHFYALFDNHMVMTDDYTRQEIKENLHIDHIVNDVKLTCKGSGLVNVVILDDVFAKIKVFDVLC